MAAAAVVLLRRCEKTRSSKPLTALHCASAVCATTEDLPKLIRCLAHVYAGELHLRLTEESDLAAEHFTTALRICRDVPDFPAALLLAALTATAHAVRHFLVEGAPAHARLLIDPLRELLASRAASPPIAAISSTLLTLSAYADVLHLSLLLDEGKPTQCESLASALCLRVAALPRLSESSPAASTWADPSVLSMATCLAEATALSHSGKLTRARERCEQALAADKCGHRSAAVRGEVHLLRAALLLQCGKPVEALEALARLPAGRAGLTAAEPFAALAHAALSVDAPHAVAAQLRLALDSSRTKGAAMHDWCELWHAAVDKSDPSVRVWALRELWSAKRRPTGPTWLCSMLLEAEAMLEMRRDKEACELVSAALQKHAMEQEYATILPQALTILGTAYSRRDNTASGAFEDKAGARGSRAGSSSNSVCDEEGARAEDALMAAVGLAAQTGDVFAARRALLEVGERHGGVGNTGLGNTGKRDEIEEILSEKQAQLQAAILKAQASNAWRLLFTTDSL
ncbi:hypothetical protein AB1Y20_019194 [Prymnesium parvum]|uniref:Protein ZIP4 homolog n=1 Tax=Prymnesium parvum TaxID=97485 RepID=A0AB34JTJ9_PRYPA